MKNFLIKILVSLAILNSVLFFIGCQSGSSTQNQKVTTNVVTIKNLAFAPQNLELKAGDEVRWVNGDAAPHEVILPNIFDSGLIQPGTSFTYSFDKPGHYEYSCSIHPTMLGVIDVK
jgi:plastocyanin